ncbi:hypothetical protein [Micromonospora yangpuensis]|uniref:Uncharacterized protein n=1 Tax=Micromonospora yangpuensis TaxID=683228 RepID=A0A1C6VFJ1_9ACTN|nr:hypothetical protein [Micromonospora yangpuensis]GGM14395.1 hypothetical protein GCM10012279_35630 [Micromonospora yangpuensis]SCL64640.1 hypothetical protein GA0070617_5519 [Micromonospora yangpuensis]
MSTSEVVTAVIAALLGGGGLAFLQALFSGIGSLRSGARAHERESVQDLARARDKADERANRAETDRDFWRNTAGGYAYQLRLRGAEPNPPDPVPPSARDDTNNP